MNMFSVGKITKYWLILFKIESGAETRSQTFQFLIDILNQNQDVEFVIHAFFR
jgi:transcriptional/translational regulatory protein YebC/TACO1